MGGNYDLERVIACDKGGAHRAENVRYVCTIKDCAMKEPLLCEVCRIKWHRDHPVMSVNDLLTEVKHRVSAQRLKDYTNLSGTIEEAERVCQESFANWKKSIALKVSSIESLMQTQFQYLRECEGIFDEHHSRQVIQDIATMQKQSDLGILRNQIKEILPFMTFNQPSRIQQGSYSSSKSFSQPITTTLKSLSNKLLGLPPISSTDILSFQQCFLTALLATQNIINSQVSTLKNITKSSLNSTAHMHDLENNHNTNNPNDSFLSQTQGNTTFLNNSLVPQPPKSQQQISAAIPLPQFKLDYSNLNSGERSSRSQSYQQRASLSQAASKSFITPRGTYKASDLINFYLNPMSDKLQKGYEPNTSKRGSFSQWIPSQNSTVRQVLPFYGKADIAAGQDYQQAAGNVLEDVQRQVDGIQKSLGDLRSSLGGQQSSRGEEGSPSRSINKQNKLRQSSLELPSGQNSVRNQSGILNYFSQQAFTPGGQVITGNYSQQQSRALDFDLSRRNSEAVNSCNINNQRNNCNFSDRFQQFREYSRSLSKEKGMNQTYQRYGYEDNNINTSRRGSMSSQEQTDIKGQQSSNQKRVKFQFSKELHHEFVNVSKYIASGLKDHFQTRLVLLEPTVEIVPHREVSFSFRIKSCKNMEYGQPLALGLCHKSIVEANNFEFPQKEERIRPSSAAATKPTAEISHSPHGCYLLTSSGFLRNHAYQKQDMKKVPVRFTAEDTIICHFNPFRKTLKFTKKSSQESCTLNVDIIPLDKLYPCVRISYAQDSVEYIQE